MHELDRFLTSVAESMAGVEQSELQIFFTYMA